MRKNSQLRSVFDQSLPKKSEIQSLTIFFTKKWFETFTGQCVPIIDNRIYREKLVTLVLPQYCIYYIILFIYTIYFFLKASKDSQTIEVLLAQGAIERQFERRYATSPSLFRKDFGKDFGTLWKIFLYFSSEYSDFAINSSSNLIYPYVAKCVIFKFF